MLELKPGRYYQTIWFVDSADQTMDWMAYVFRDGDGPWLLEYRFRYYADGEAFDSEDRKSWYAGKAPPDAPLDKLIEVVDIVAEATSKRYGGKIWRLPVESDDPRVAMAILKKQPWCHMKFQKVPS